MADPNNRIESCDDDDYSIVSLVFSNAITEGGVPGPISIPYTINW